MHLKSKDFSLFKIFKGIIKVYFRNASTDDECHNYYDELNSSVEKEHRKRRQRKYTCNSCNDVSFSKYDQIESHLKVSLFYVIFVLF